MRRLQLKKQSYSSDFLGVTTTDSKALFLYFLPQVCGKVLSSASSYYVHMKLHSGNKPYHCTACDASFCRKPYLEVSDTFHLRPFSTTRISHFGNCWNFFKATIFLSLLALWWEDSTGWAGYNTSNNLRVAIISLSPLLERYSCQLPNTIPREFCSCYENQKLWIRSNTAKEICVFNEMCSWTFPII